MKLQRSGDVEAAALEGELLLFSAKANKFFVMNSTAAALWEALVEPRDEEGLAAVLCAKFSGVSPGQALDDVRMTVQTMQELGLISD